MSSAEYDRSNLNGFSPDDYIKLLTAAFPEDDPEAPILGVTDDVEIAPTMRALLEDPSLIVSSLEEDGRLIGCSIAMPIDRMDPSRRAEATETAYIYYTAVDPSRQHQGLVAQVNDAMVRRLQERGYLYVEQDNVIANGHADKIKKNYRASIVKSYEHTNFPEVGPEVFVRIHLGRVAMRGPR